MRSFRLIRRNSRDILISSRFSDYLFIYPFSRSRVVQARRTILSSLAKHSRIERFLSSSPQQFAKLQNAQGYEYATRSWRGRGRGGAERRGLQKGDGGCNGTDRENGRFRIFHGISRARTCPRVCTLILTKLANKSARKNARANSVQNGRNPRISNVKRLKRFARRN